MKQYQYKSFEMVPWAATDLNGEVVDLGEVLTGIASDVRAVTALAEWELFNDPGRLFSDLDSEDGGGSPSGVAWKFGIANGFGSFPESWVRGRSRYVKLVQHRVVSEGRSWLARVKAKRGDGDVFVSQGWARTVDDSAPSMGLFYNLGAVDSQFAVLDCDDSVMTLRVIVDGVWRVLFFDLPKRYVGCDKVTLPVVRLTGSGGLVFQFSAAYEYVFGDLSSRYVVGVDVGVNKYAVVSVWDTVLGESVFCSDLSERVHGLWNSIRASQRQVGVLQRAGRGDEARLHREANVRKKRELAIVAAQEVAAVAVEWGNAVVVFEDLGWVNNTMSHGRWNRGAFREWTRHYVELNGSRLFTVSAARTSTTCSVCAGVLGDTGVWAVKWCPGCLIEVDRDENASAVVAQRFVSKLPKVVATRAKAKSYRRGTVRRSPVAHSTQKNPHLRMKFAPTPKRRRKALKVVDFHSLEVNSNQSGSVIPSQGRVITDDSSSWKIRTLKKQPHQALNPNQRV